MAKEPLESKRNCVYVCVSISSISYSPYKTATANMLLCYSEDTLDFLLAISSAQDDLKFIDSFL